MSKDLSTVAVLGTIALSTALWNRLQSALKDSSNVFENKLRTASNKVTMIPVSGDKITKKAVVNAINEMKEGERKELMTRLSSNTYNYEDADEIVGILKKANIIRGNLQGQLKKKPPASDKEAEQKAGADQKARENAEELRKRAITASSDIISTLKENVNKRIDAEEMKQVKDEMTDEDLDRLENDLIDEMSPSEYKQFYEDNINLFDAFKGLPTTEERQQTSKEKKNLRKDAERGAKRIMTILKKRVGSEISKKMAVERKDAIREKKDDEEVNRLARALGRSNIATSSDTGAILESIRTSQETLESKIDALTISSEQIKVIRDKIDTKLDPSRKYSKLQLDKKVVDELIDTIPEGNRQTLGRAIRGVVGTGELKMNDLLSGLVGLEVGLLTTPSAGVFATGIINQIFDMYNINLNTILSPSESPSASTASAIPITINIKEEDQVDDAVEQPATETKGDNKQRSINRGLHRLVEYARNLRLPSPQEIRDGAVVGAVSSAVSAGLSSGSAMNTVSAGFPGFRAGGYAGVVTAPMLDVFLRTNNITLNPNMKRAIQLLPPALVASYIGYTPPGAEVSGAGTLSGAGVTESKLTVPQSVIDQTSAQLDQKESKNKVWQPKSISPSTDILNESRQERYADDLEFIAFNYIPPTSEGAQGTVDTNPLKYSQAKENSIRYDGAGVSVPYLLWNKVNDANEMTAQRIEKLAMGVQLPEMIFIDQDNDTTFENVAEWQYPNGENTAIEFLSPYSDFSNVDNYWIKNETNILFTVNP